MAVKHVFELVSQELSSLRQDLADPATECLETRLQGGALCSSKGRLSAQPLMATLLQTQDSAARFAEAVRM